MVGWGIVVLVGWPNGANNDEMVQISGEPHFCGFLVSFGQSSLVVVTADFLLREMVQVELLDFLASPWGLAQ